jgi:Xaa-Pro aminopeptidase
VTDSSLDGRSEVLERELGDLGAQALLIVAGSSRDPDLAPFVGPVHLGRSFLLLPRPGSPRGPLLGYLARMERDGAAATGLDLLTPEALEVDRLSREHPASASFWGALLCRALDFARVPPGRIAVAGHLGAGHAIGFAGALEAEEWTPVDGHRVVRMLRKRKDGGQLEAIREAAAGTLAAFRRVACVLAASAGDEVRPGDELAFEGAPLTVGRLRHEIFRVVAEHGLEQPEGNIVAPAEEAAVPHTTGTDERPLRAGESLVVDLFPRGRLYADCTRTFCVGPAPEALATAHATVLDALHGARAAARAGVRGWDLQEAACQHFEAHGYDDPIRQPATTEGYVHGLGHGVGFELHELPSFRKEAELEGVLEAGDVVTLEPGLYSPTAGYGVRLEDLVAVGDDGIAEDLTPLPYDLDPRAW